MKNTFGGYVSGRKSKKENHKKAWNWWLGNIDLIIKFLELIYPFLKNKDKIKKAELIIEDYKYRIKKGISVTEEDILNNKIFYKEFHKNK